MCCRCFLAQDFHFHLRPDTRVMSFISPAENLHYAIGELAYAIARADGAIQRQERDHLRKMIKEELQGGGYEFDVTGIIFHLLEKNPHAYDCTTAYDWAMREIRMNSHYLSPVLKEKFQSLLEKVAKAYGTVTIEERDIIERFREDIAPLNGDPIYYEKSHIK
jgi:uncharacterized tellurite resistance protein B-like protein